MSKKKKNGESVVENPADLYETEVEEEVETAPHDISNKELFALFKAWEETEAPVQEAEKLLEEAKEVRSRAIQDILEKAGGGRYEYPEKSGRILIPVARKSYDEAGNEKRTYFFKSPTKGEIRVVSRNS